MNYFDRRLEFELAFWTAWYVPLHHLAAGTQ
jgi:hypothetical protein